MSWEQKLQQLGYDEQTAPASIKKAIKDLRSFENALTSTSDNKEIETFENAIVEQKVFIEHKINSFEKNKEQYGVMTERLKQMREKKAIAKNAAKPTPTPTPTPAPAPTPTPTPAPIPKDEEKKGNGLAWTIFAIAVAVVTIGAVNMNKNE